MDNHPGADPGRRHLSDLSQFRLGLRSRGTGSRYSRRGRRVQAGRYQHPPRQSPQRFPVAETALADGGATAMSWLANSSILLTGGTGSFGRTFAAMTLAKFNPPRLVIYSRDEMKQWEMARHFTDDKRVRFFIGDVRDADRLTRALDGIDYVVHAAALKIVPTAEYNPFECVKTNIIGAMNLIDVCINRGVKRVVALSTDKASAPVNLYGATKLVSDKLFVAGNAYAGGHDTRFAVVRYGNVMGSRGSVIPLFMSLAGEGPLPITDSDMTRFMVTLEEGVELVWHAFDDMEGGEIYVRKSPSMKIVDIACAVDPKSAPRIVGIRPGEKLHEQMISAGCALHFRLWRS